MFSNRKRELRQRKMIIAGLSVMTVLLFVLEYYTWKNESLPVVTIQVEDVSIYPDESVPEFIVHVSADEQTQQIELDSKDKYTVKQLLDELNNGQGYQIQCDLDSENLLEGEYKIKLVLTENMEERISQDWKKLITLEIKEGILKVNNPLGEWEKDKFKRRDGTYVTDEFLNLNGETYYFDENGKKVTGKKEIWGKEYYFSKTGEFDNKKNEINPVLPMIALTFDDGPGKYTEELLNVLEEYDAKATFFMVGTNVKKYPEAVKRMKEIGCEIGNHTTDHARLTDLTEEAIVAQVETTNAAIKSIISESATVVRPPYGAVNDLVKEAVDYPLIFWNVDTLDWENQDVAAIVNHTTKSIKDGDIVLMHDIYETTIDAAIQLVIQLKEEGYQLVTVSEMAAARGIQLQTGEEYARFRPNVK